MQDPELAAIRKRLDVIIALLLQQVDRGGERLSSKAQIQMLSALGVRPVEIADILGKPRNYINKELVLIRRRKARST
jgi:hypothetical protein